MQKGWLHPCNTDDIGAFPQLESFGVYKIEVIRRQREIRSTKRTTDEENNVECRWLGDMYEHFLKFS